MKLNIGCGNDKLEGWVNADARTSCNPDVKCVLGETLPFKDDQFDEVRAFNVLTQVSKIRKAMNELWRVTNGFILIRVPDAANICAFQDPMDFRHFTDQSFTYMEHGHRRYEQYGKMYGFKPFKVELLEHKEQMLFKLTPVKI